MCFTSFNVVCFIVCMADSKYDINCSQNLRCPCLVSLLATTLLGLNSISLSMFFVWRYFLYAKFFCSTIKFISLSNIHNFFFCVNALYFPKLSSATCEIMFLTFLHSTTILLLSGISCSFSWILCMYSHCIHSSLSN